MINTYNETSLHKELKAIYAQKHQGNTEIEIENYICDIACSDENSTIIEIQTSNLSKLTKKIEKLTKFHKVKLIYPLATTTYLQDLIPKEIPENFSSKDLKNTEVKAEANKMIWVLRKANLIEQVEKKGNLIIYKKTSLE